MQRNYKKSDGVITFIFFQRHKQHLSAIETLINIITCYQQQMQITFAGSIMVAGFACFTAHCTVNIVNRDTIVASS